MRAARGDGRVAAVSVAPHGDTRAHELAVDSVCLAIGRNPDFGLALQLGIDLTYEAARGGHLPARDARGLTSVPNLYVAGDAAGTREVADALLDGARVGLAAAGGDPDGAPALVADLLGTGG